MAPGYVRGSAGTAAYALIRVPIASCGTRRVPGAASILVDRASSPIDNIKPLTEDVVCMAKNHRSGPGQITPATQRVPPEARYGDETRAVFVSPEPNTPTISAMLLPHYQTILVCLIFLINVYRAATQSI